MDSWIYVWIWISCRDFRMTKIDTTPETIKAIYAHYESKPQWRRPHLGASEIGSACDRKLWYNFRWCLQPKFEGRMLRLFETGNREEERIVQNLRDIGIEVHDLNPKTGKQIHYIDPECAHFSGSLDGMGKGFIEAPKAWHVLEFKTASKKQWEALDVAGVLKHKPEHFAQMQIYMHWSKVDRAYYISVCKDDDRMYGERIHYDKEIALKLIDRAHRIIHADEAPNRCKGAKNPKEKGWSPCVYCDFKSICYGKKCPEVNCRTCGQCDFNDNGDVVCRGYNAAGDLKLSTKKQQEACKNHLFIPSLVPLECCGVDAEKREVTYLFKDGSTFANGKGEDQSSEILMEMINNET